MSLVVQALQAGPILVLLFSIIKMKIKAENLWPLILHFVEEYFGEDDLKAFKQYFELTIEHD